MFSFFPNLDALDPSVNRRLEKTRVAGSKAHPEYAPAKEKGKEGSKAKTTANRDRSHCKRNKTPSATLDWRATSEQKRKPLYHCLHNAREMMSPNTNRMYTQAVDRFY